MARYITRVELHGATAGDYEKLHLFMAARAFRRTIIADNGTVYDLPSATYFSEGQLSAGDVRAHALLAAAATGRSSWVLVTEAGDIFWQLCPVNALAAVTRVLGLPVAPLSAGNPSW